MGIYSKEHQQIHSWFQLNKLHTQMINDLERSLQQAHQLSLNEFYVLFHLNQHEQKKLRLQQLQEMVGLSQSAMSRLVMRLEAKTCGVLQRVLCESDRRGIYTAITTHGEEKFAGAYETFRQTLQQGYANEMNKLTIRSILSAFD